MASSGPGCEPCPDQPCEAKTDASPGRAVQTACRVSKDKRSSTPSLEEKKKGVRGTHLWLPRNDIPGCSHAQGAGPSDSLPANTTGCWNTHARLVSGAPPSPTWQVAVCRPPRGARLAERVLVPAPRQDELCCPVALAVPIVSAGSERSRHFPHRRLAMDHAEPFPQLAARFLGPRRAGVQASYVRSTSTPRDARTCVPRAGGRSPPKIPCSTSWIL